MERLALDEVTFDAETVRTVDGPIDALVKGFRWSVTAESIPRVDCRSEEVRAVGTVDGDIRLDGTIYRQVGGVNGVTTQVVPSFPIFGETNDVRERG